MLNAGSYGTGARWFLDAAVEHNDRELAEWCLAHGANPNSAPGSRRNRQRPLYEEAVFRGHMEVAEFSLDMARRARRWRSRRSRRSSLRACARTRRDPIRNRQPSEFLKSHEALFASAKYNRREAVRLLLDLGVSPNIESPQGERALHIAAYDDAVDVGEL
jgi:hypothetical protein